MHKKKATGAGLIWALILTGSLLVPSAASAEPPSLNLTIEDIELTLDSTSDPIQYLTFTSDSHEQLNFTLESTEAVEVTLYRAYDLENLIGVGFIHVPDQETSLLLPTLPNECNVENNAATNPACNLFELHVEVTSEDENFEDLSFIFHLLRRYDVSEFDVDINWYLPGEVEDGEPFSSSVTMQQGWFRLPDEEDPSFPPINYWGFLAGFDDSDEGSRQLGEYVPIFADETFEAYWFFNPTVIQIFDNLLIPDICPEEVIGELCLNLVDNHVDLYDELPPVGKGIGSEEYFLTLATSRDFTLGTDDNDNLFPQEIGVLWPVGSTNRIASLSHQDHRIPQGYGDPLTRNDQSVFIGADSEYFAVPDNREFATFPMSDETICSPDEICKRVWDLNIAFTDSKNRAQSFHINLILFDASEPPPVFDFSWYPDHPSEFSVEDTPISAELDINGTNDFVDLRNFWLYIPDATNFDFFVPEDVNLSYEPKPNHHFEGWSTLSNAASEVFPKPYFPLVQNEILYWVWEELYTVTFFDGNQAIDDTQTWGESTLEELAPDLPAGATGWGLSASSSALRGNYVIDEATNLYAIYPPRNRGGGGGFVPPAPEPTPVPTPEPTTTPDAQLPATKTTVKITYENGVTTILATIPPGYVNRPTRVEKRLVIGGKVRYSVLGRAWTHFDKVTRDTSKATMTFKFRGKLKTTDRFRVVVKGITVIKAYGDGKPAWR